MKEKKSVRAEEGWLHQILDACTCIEDHLLNFKSIYVVGIELATLAVLFKN